MLKSGVRVQTWDCPPLAKFCKNSSRGYTYLGKIYTKNLKFLRLWATSADISYLLGYVEIGTNLRNTRNSSTTQNFVTIAQGILHGACRYCIASRRWCILISSLFLSRFGMTKFVITETLWSGVLFKTIMVSLRRGRFVVVHLCSTFLWIPKFSYKGKFVPKIAIFRVVCGCRPTVLKPERWNFVQRCWLGTSSRKPTFIKTT